MSVSMPHTCPVCDYPDLEEEPYYSYEICLRCGVEFGYELFGEPGTTAYDAYVEELRRRHKEKNE